MFPVRYIHAADLHLDAAFKGLRRQSDGLLPQLEETLLAATFVALDRLVALCEREKPDFLVLAGDIYNEEDQSLKAQLAVRDACVRLSKSHIPVFIVHGNHDPLSSRLAMIEWPSNTVIFSGEVQSHVLKPAAELLAARQSQGHEDTCALAPSEAMAVIHGISHTSNREARNLAKAFTRLGGEHGALFQLGLLHCAVENVAHAERYAPCTLEDLHATGLDAWALGHVHERRILSASPFVAYAGNTQGLHVNETGHRGCYLVTAQPVLHGSDHENTGHAGKGAARYEVQAEFHSLSAVIWEKVTISLENVTQITELEERVQDVLEVLATEAPVHCQALIVRIILQGHTTLDAELRYKDVGAELIKRWQSSTSGQPLVWLKDMVVETSPVLAMDELVKRDDLLGETLRLSRQLQEESVEGQAFVERTLAPLFGHARAKNVLIKPQEEDLPTLLENAARLCADIMESK